MEASNVINNLIEDNKPTLITGDFNVCYRQNTSNAISRSLVEQGFSQMVGKATHVMGGMIDHAYWKDNSDSWYAPEIETFSPYYSDHDAILVTMKRIK